MSAANPLPWPIDSGQVLPNALHEADRQEEAFEEDRFQFQRWEAIGRLTGGVVHDFNNLLTGSTLYCDLLLSSLDLRGRERRYAEQIRSALLQAGGLAQQLLVFARPQAEPVGAVSLNEIVEGMRDLLARLIGENITLELRLDAQLGPVEIARSQAQQVLLNLVLNARDAMPDGGRITIETSNCRFQPLAGADLMISNGAFPCILLAVRDNGCGMEPGTLRRLFEPFFTTKTPKGSGLGLTTVRSIVMTNRGLIHFESYPGRGTHAMILLPAAAGLTDPAVPLDCRPRLQQPSSTPLQAVKKEPLL